MTINLGLKQDFKNNADDIILLPTTRETGRGNSPVCYAGINFMHNHPPEHPEDLHQKFAPTLGLLHPSFCPGEGGDLSGQLPMGGHLSINDVCHF